MDKDIRITSGEIVKQHRIENQKPCIRQVIAVEGRYDKNSLSQVVDALIFETGGFSIFHNRERLETLRTLAKTRGLILLTDPDDAGRLIRSRLKGLLPEIEILHAYVPEIPGKESRKRKASGAGLLGVEGMTPELLLEALRRAGADIVSEEEKPEEYGEMTAERPGDWGDRAPEGKRELSSADFYRLGLSGRNGSDALRSALARSFGLPGNLNQSDLRRALSDLVSYEELQMRIEQLKDC